MVVEQTRQDMYPLGTSSACFPANFLKANQHALIDPSQICSRFDFFFSGGQSTIRMPTPLIPSAGIKVWIWCWHLSLGIRLPFSQRSF